MMVKLNKVGEQKWDVVSNGQTVGKVGWSYKHHGSYEAKLNNGIVINAFSQKSLKSMISKNI